LIQARCKPCLLLCIANYYDMPIPDVIEKKEHLARNVFYPQHIKKSGRLKWQAYRPNGNGEVSVFRLKYCGESFCHEFGKIQTKDKRIYSGFIRLIVLEIFFISSQLSVIATPTKDSVNEIDLPFHADIIFPYKPVYGEPMPEKYITICRQLADKASDIVKPKDD